MSIYVKPWEMMSAINVKSFCKEKIKKMIKDIVLNPDVKETAILQPPQKQLKSQMVLDTRKVKFTAFKAFERECFFFDCEN